jgi:hypothetical protein
MSDYPKVKYKGAAAAVPYDCAKPGFTAVKVMSADEEKSLGDGYFDTPAEAIEAFKGQEPTASERADKLRAELADLEKQTQAEIDAAAKAAGEDPRPAAKTADWPTERKKR